MKKSICGADCNNCAYGIDCGCKGCVTTGGCPFGKKCFIAEYIKSSGEECYNLFKEDLIDEFNSLNITGMPKIDKLFALNGSFVNLAYPMPNGSSVKLLDDNEIYLGNQIECKSDGGSLVRYLGLVAGIDFLLVCEYGENCTEPQIIVYKKR